jgi:hypothetical protein
MIGSSSLRRVAGSLFSAVGFSVFGLVPARLEHRKHSIGDRKSAGSMP